MSRSVPLFLNGAKVDPDFCDALFDQANRAGITVNEYVLQAAGEKLRRSGADVSGVFRLGDLDLGRAA